MQVIGCLHESENCCEHCSNGQIERMIKVKILQNTITPPSTTDRESNWFWWDSSTFHSCWVQFLPFLSSVWEGACTNWELLEERQRQKEKEEERKSTIAAWSITALSVRQDSRAIQANNPQFNYQTAGSRAGGSLSLSAQLVLTETQKHTLSQTCNVLIYTHIPGRSGAMAVLLVQHLALSW